MSFRNQDGYTLIEVIVVAVVIGLISVPLTTFTIKAFTSYLFVETQSNASIDLLMLSNRMTTILRGATAVDTAQDNTIIVFAYKNPTDAVVSKYRYFISGNTLSLGITPPSGSAPNYTYLSGNEVVKVLRNDLVMGGRPMFVYYDEDGSQLASGFNVGQVRQIDLYLSANPRPAQLQEPIVTQNRAMIRNTKVNL